MKKGIILLILLLSGCASKYNQVRLKVGVEIPIPIMPIDIGLTLELKDALPEVETDEQIFKKLLDDAALDRIVNGVRKSGESGGQYGGNDLGHTQDSSDSSGQS